jgi:hypothetical protein
MAFCHPFLFLACHFNASSLRSLTLGFFYEEKKDKIPLKYDAFSIFELEEFK